MWLFLWGCFVLFTSSVKLSSIKYLNICLLMLYSIFLQNLVTPIKTNLKTAIFISILPNLIFWYIFIIYNNFLSVNPFQHEFLVFVLFCYTYVLLSIVLNP